jgi:transcriptional regulator with XRE-family HTH domain
MTTTHGQMRPVDIKLAELLNQARKDARITTKHLAEHLGWSESKLWARLTGRKPLYVHDMVALAAAVGVSGARLLRQAVADGGVDVGKAPPREQVCRREGCGRKFKVPAGVREEWCGDECRRLDQNAAWRERYAQGQVNRAGG